MAKHFSRRDVLVSALGATAVLATGARASLASSSTSPQALQSALKSGVPPNDGLAHPIPYTPPLGAGKDRALALGGGAFYLTAFYAGYFTSLAAHGADVSLADIMVGTSAGTLASYALLTGHVSRLKELVTAIGKNPAVMNYQAANPPFSSVRAGFVGNNLPTATVENIQELGRAAMAAHTPPVAQWQRLINRLTGAAQDWPSPKFHTTAIDCYTAQRLVVSANDGVPAVVAMSASSSWPGLAGPTPLKDRTAMDGGTCATSTHSDVVAGAKRVLIVSLASGDDARDAAQGLRLSHFPNTLKQEVADLKSGGSRVMLQVVGCPPGYSKISLVDPALIPVALRYGLDRGAADAAAVKRFWLD